MMRPTDERIRRLRDAAESLPPESLLSKQRAANRNDFNLESFQFCSQVTPKVGVGLRGLSTDLILRSPQKRASRRRVQRTESGRTLWNVLRDAPRALLRARSEGSAWELRLPVPAAPCPLRRRMARVFAGGAVLEQNCWPRGARKPLRLSPIRPNTALAQYARAC